MYTWVYYQTPNLAPIDEEGRGTKHGVYRHAAGYAVAVTMLMVSS